MDDFDFAALKDGELLLEDLPEDVEKSMADRDAWIASLPPNAPGDEFVISDLQKWPPGSTVRVGFMGGGDALRREVAQVAEGLNGLCNVTLDFGGDASTGNYRSWTASDTEHQADIRVSFDKKGYWSLVGTDSVNVSIGSTTSDTGGRPHQRSLNLGGFAVHRPIGWRGTVLHEFLHALGFKHEHQNLRGPCKDEFRWDDDPSYVASKDYQGRFINDSGGRRPGIYTYLAGFPNFWTKSKVDRNLRTLHQGDATFGVFDPRSIMLYRFDALFYKSNPSACAPIGDGNALSEGDKEGLRKLYPMPGDAMTKALARRQSMLSKVVPAQPELPGVEFGRGAPSMFATAAIKILSRS